MRLTLVSILAVLLCCSVVAAQDAPDTVASLAGIEIRTAVDRADMYVGDLITYTVTIKYDSSYQLIPPPLGANLGSFDVKDYQTDIITRLDDGRMQSRNEFILSTFTTGEYIIPPLPVIFELPDGSRKLLLSEPIPIKVNSLLTNLGDSADIRPAKPPIEFVRDRSLYWYIGGGALLLLVAAFLLWFFYFRKEESVELIDNREPWEIAFADIAALQQTSLLMQQQYKEFYFELTEIVRRYLGLIYHVNTLDMTTEEFLNAFQEIELPSGLLASMRDFLDHADLVKFAKLAPQENRPSGDVELAHRVVELVRVEHLRKLAAAKEEAEAA